MHEILFKARRVDNGEWVEGGFWLNDTATRQTMHVIDYDGNSHAVDPATLCQYTGFELYKDPLNLRGEDGKVKLFESDKIKFSTFDINGGDTQHIGVVYWCDGAFWVDCIETESVEGIYRLGTVMMEDDCVEVCDSIHTTPELMGEREREI